MGFASYMEDIRDRLAEDLAECRRRIADAENLSQQGTYPAGYFEQLGVLKSVYRQCDIFLHDINSMVELATTPEADTIHELNIEVTKLRKGYRKMRAKNQSLEEELKKLQEELKVEKERRKESDRKFRSLNDKLAEDKDTFAKAVDSYSSDQAIKQHKPDEFKKRRR